MRVIVYAQDLSDRKDDGYYSKPNIDAALDVFFNKIDDKNFFDQYSNEPLSREDAKEIFEVDGQVSFYNVDEEKIVLTLDRST